MQKMLDLKFYSAAQLTEPPVIKSTASGKKHFENHIRLGDEGELRPQVFAWVRASYELL